MKSFKEIPFLLLFSYLSLCFFRSPQLSDSIIILGLVGLYCFRLFEEYHPKPSIDQQLDLHMQKVKSEVEDFKKEQKDNVKKIQEDVGNFTRDFATLKGLTLDDRLKETQKQNSRIKF